MRQGRPYTLVALKITLRPSDALHDSTRFAFFRSVGAAILRGDWQGACSMLLAPRPRDNEEVVHARAAYSRGDMGAALRLMPRECVAERAVLEVRMRCVACICVHMHMLSRAPPC